MIETILAFMAANPAIFYAIGADILAGWLPKKWIRWPGLILTAAKHMHAAGDSGKATRTIVNERILELMAEHKRVMDEHKADKL